VLWDKTLAGACAEFRRKHGTAHIRGHSGVNCCRYGLTSVLVPILSQMTKLGWKTNQCGACQTIRFCSSVAIRNYEKRYINAGGIPRNNARQQNTGHIPDKRVILR
jgi:hypothetical protein